MAPEGIHAPYLAPLIAAGDWAALARYWIAHWHVPALDAAIATAHRLAAVEMQWAALPGYLEKVKASPLNPSIKLPETFDAIAKDAAAATSHLYPLVALCEKAVEFPIEDQERLFRGGIEVTERAAQLAFAAQDTALASVFIAVLARGIQELRQIESAAQLYGVALELRRHLAQARPEVYQPFVAATLNNSGIVQSALNDFEAARAHHGEALQIRRELAQTRPEVYRPYVATTLNNLGNVQRALNDLEAARTSFEEALGIYRELGGLRRVLREFPDLGGESTEPNRAPTDEAARLLADAEARHAALLLELRRADPEWEPDRPVKLLTSAEIQALIPADAPTAFVQITLTEDTGLALVLTPGSIDCVKLPALTDRAGAEAALAWFTAYDLRGEDRGTWEHDMDALLAPIGTALLPLWEALEARGIQRAVLSPNRWLHIFPVQACLLADGKPRVADVFEISYTPSFSVLGRCAGRARAATGAALIVGNPTGDLDFAEAEVASAMCHYPEASVLTHSSAKKELILSESAKCCLFLYTCHAKFDEKNPVHSALVLETKDETQRAKWLSLGDAFCRLNLGQCALAVLNGCESGMLQPDRTDEYLALSSGFLHAGAVRVLSTLWAVHDLSAALLMDRFHTEWLGGKNVGAALREAARWLREDIRSGDDLVKRVLPEFLREIEEGTELYKACIARAEGYAAHSQSRPPFESPAHWAAFTVVGKAW